MFRIVIWGGGGGFVLRYDIFQGQVIFTDRRALGSPGGTLAIIG